MHDALGISRRYHQSAIKAELSVRRRGVKSEAEHSTPAANASVLQLDDGLSTVAGSPIQIASERFHRSGFPVTVDCICARLGPVRCKEGLARAYLYGHDDVISSLALLSNGSLPGPAQALCAALGG